MINKLKIVFKMLKNGSFIDYLNYKKKRRLILKIKYPLDKQKSELVNIMKYACKHCEYYKSLKITINTSVDISKFPLLSKRIIRKNYDKLISDKKDKLLFTIARTGGSTGEPLEFIKSLGFDDLFQEKLWKLYGYKKGDIILALDGSTIESSKISTNNYLYKKSNKQLPYGGYGLSSMYLSTSNIHLYVDELLKLKPSFIRGYPSFVYRIAKYIYDNKINITFKVKAVELTSETSLEYQCQLIGNVFGCKVFLQYGHTECCAFGYTYDKSFKYRMEPLYGYVEVLKENGEHAKEGEIGEIVVTSLYNKVMPLIRYQTGDYAEYGFTDEKGVVLNKILGRTQDYVLSYSHEKILLTSLIHAQHDFKALGHIEEWQIEQNEFGKVILHIVKGRDYNELDEEEIKEVFKKYADIDVVFDYCTEITLTKRGKSLLVRQTIIQ